jgi:hypothetical protein
MIDALVTATDNFLPQVYGIKWVQKND